MSFQIEAFQNDAFQVVTVVHGTLGGGRRRNKYSRPSTGASRAPQKADRIKTDQKPRRHDG